MDVCCRRWQYRNSPYLKVSRAGLSWSQIRVSMAQEHRFRLVLLGSYVHRFHEVTRIRKSVNHTFQVCGREHQAGKFTSGRDLWYRLRCWQQAFLALGLVVGLCPNIPRDLPHSHNVRVHTEMASKWHGRAEESRDDLAPTCSFHPLHIVEDQPVCLGSHGFFSGIMATVPSLCTWQGSNILLNIEGLPSLGCSFLASHLDEAKKKIF